MMYDLLAHVPIGPTESFDVQFDVVEAGRLGHYLAKCFGNSTRRASRAAWSVSARRCNAPAGLGSGP